MTYFIVIVEAGRGDGPVSCNSCNHTDISLFAVRSSSYNSLSQIITFPHPPSIIIPVGSVNKFKMNKLILSALTLLYYNVHKPQTEGVLLLVFVTIISGVSESAARTPASQGGTPLGQLIYKTRTK